MPCASDADSRDRRQNDPGLIATPPMQKLRTPLLVLVGIIAAGMLFYRLTMQSQTATCEVCVAFNGGQNCAKASGASEAEAARTAQTTACGVLTNGMNDAIACQSRPPVAKRCPAN
jgi:hypothetical protein